MSIARAGTILVLGGCLVAAFAVAYAMTGNAVGLGLQGFGGLVVIGALGLLGVGSACLGLARPSRLRGRAVRVSLAIFAVGALALTTSALAAASSEFDPFESLPMLVLTIGGGVLLLVGMAALAITVPLGISRRRGEIPISG